MIKKVPPRKGEGPPNKTYIVGAMPPHRPGQEWLSQYTAFDRSRGAARHAARTEIDFRTGKLSGWKCAIAVVDPPWDDEMEDIEAAFGRGSLIFVTPVWDSEFEDAARGPTP